MAMQMLQQVSLQELQQKADVLSLHIPWTPETDKMINTNFINAFAKPFWFINTSREEKCSDR
jgi:D-3-phosphoglycerate dehydrogenase / 2-oxoglutarate reductase